MPLPINIEVLLSEHVIESERIELKKGWNPQVILHSICAFANDFNNLGGGYIVVGVEENDGLAVMPPFGIDRGSVEELRPLNVGLLMFSDDPTQHFRGTRIELVEFQDDIGDKFRETIFNGPLWLQLKDVLRYIRHSIVKEQVVKVEGKAEADRYYNYPYEALEEAIANAVFHKGYDEQSPIEVSIRHDCIEILSFPGPVPPVNNESLKLERIIARSYRNSRLGDFLKELHLTEGRSTGIPKIRRFMKRNESPEPKFETNPDNTYFLTTFYPHVLDELSDTVVTELPLGDQSKAQSRDQVGTKSKPNEINPPNKLLEELRRKDQLKAQSGAQSKDQSGAEWGDGLDKQQSRILDTIGSELSSGEIAHEMGLKSKSGSFKESLSELIKQGKIEYTLPETPKSRL